MNCVRRERAAAGHWLVRFRPGVVGETRRACHLVPIPGGAPPPAAGAHSASVRTCGVSGCAGSGGWNSGCCDCGAPDGPELVALCGARIACGQAELLAEPVGMGCEPCSLIAARTSTVAAQVPAKPWPGREHQHGEDPGGAGCGGSGRAGGGPGGGAHWRGYVEFRPDGKPVFDSARDDRIRREPDIHLATPWAVADWLDGWIRLHYAHGRSGEPAEDVYASLWSMHALLAERGQSVHLEVRTADGRQAIHADHIPAGDPAPQHR